MSHKYQLKNPLYRNWVRGSLALKYLKQGLEVYVDQSIQAQHSTFISNLPSSGATNIPCGQCTIENVLPDHAGSRCIHKARSKCLCCTKGRRKCPFSYCSVFIDLVIQEHSLHDPVWCNIDLKTWPSHYWKLAKCFLSSPCRNNATSAQDTDVAELLSIVINDSYLRNKIQTIDNFIKARTIRNSLVHTSNYELTDRELADDIKTFIDVLSDATLVNMVNNHAVQNAIKDLNQLKNDAIVISTEDVEEMQSYALRAIDERKEKALQEIQTNEKQILDSITDKITRQTDLKLIDLSKTIDSEKNEMLHDFREQVKAEKADVEQLKTDSIAVINDRKQRVLVQIEAYTSDCISLISNQYEKMRTNFIHGRELQEIKNEHVQDFFNQTSYIKESFLKEIEDHVQKQVTDYEVGSIIRKDENVDGDTGQQLICAEKYGTISELDTTQQDGHSKDVELVFPIGEAIQYSDIKYDFQNDLVSYYRKHHNISTVSLSQLSRTHDAPLLQVFVLPKMTFKYCDGLISRSSSPVTSYADILLHSSKPVQNVFISGPTGTGKTVLARHMCLSWCHLHRPEILDTEYFQENNITALEHFDYLFYIDLEDFPETQCDLYEIIKTQIVEKLPNAHVYCRNFFLRNIISRERCLIIIDHLDKRFHPDPTSTHYEIETQSFPQISGGNVTKVSITSQWKLGFCDLNFKQMDMKVEMEPPGLTSFENMSRVTIAYLNSMANHKKNADEFLDVVNDLDIGSDSITRICHIFLLNHWFENKLPCTSRNAVYDFLTKELFSRSERRFSINFVGVEWYSKFVERTSLSELKQDKSLVRYKEPTQSYSSRKALLKFGKLSFECLSSAKSEDVAISHVNQFLASDEIQYCLDIGVFNLNERKRLTSNTTSVSFTDPEFQAYFAAVYVSTFKSLTTLKETIDRSCVRVRKRAVSAFLVFLAGLNPQLLAEISACLYESHDGQLQEYRNGIDVGSVIELRLRHFQNVMVKCVREMLRHNGEGSFVLPQLEDIFIDESCEQVEYLQALNQLITHNKEHIKSITINSSQLSQNVLTSIEILSIPTPQKFAVLSQKRRQKTCSNPALSKSVNEALLSVIQSIVLDSADNLKCVSFGGIYLPLQKFKNILDTRQIRYMSMNQVQISDGNCDGQAVKVSLKVGIPKPYMYLCGNMPVDDSFISKTAFLLTVKLQNICISIDQLGILGKLDKVNILSLWHIHLTHVTGDKIPNTFDIYFDRHRKSIVVRGKVPNMFINAFLKSNYRDIKNIKVAFVYLTYQSLRSICRIKSPNSMLLKGITLISENDEPETSRYMEMRKTFKCELNSTSETFSLCGFAPEDVYRDLMLTYAASVKQIELRDVVLSESELKILAGIKNLELFTLVNITRKPGDKYQQTTILNTFDMVYMKEEQKLYVCGDISEYFLGCFIDTYAELLKKVDLRYVGQTTACLKLFAMLKELKELFLYFCRSDFNDTNTVISLLNEVTESLQLVRLGCLSLLSKHLALNNVEQTERSMSIREIIHSSKIEASKRDQDFASSVDNYCIQWDCTNTSLYIEGNTPEPYVNHFLRERASCTAVHLKGLSLSQSDLLELSRADNLKTLRLVDTTFQGESESDVDVLSTDDKDSEIGEDSFETDSFFDESDDEADDITNKDEETGPGSGRTNFDDGLSEMPAGEIEDKNQGENKEIGQEDLEFVDKNDCHIKHYSDNENNQKPQNIQFEHFEEKLFASGEFTDPMLFKILLKFCEMSKKVRLINVKLRHKRAKEIFSCIDMKTDIELIEIESVKCFDHENCDKIAMNLSDHVHLQSLALISTHVTQVKINGENLRACKIDSMVVPGIVTSILENLHPNVIDTLELISIRDGRDIDTVTKVLPTLKGLHSLEMCWINIYDKDFKLFLYLKQLDRLVLRNVSMTFEAFRHIIEYASNVKKAVRVRFNNCKLAEGSAAQANCLKNYVTQATGCKIEEEWNYENGHFSGIYVI